MCVVGDKQVGKTSLVQFLMGDSVSNPNELVNQYIVLLRDSTHGQRFRIWDICGDCNDSLHAMNR